MIDKALKTLDTVQLLNILKNDAEIGSYRNLSDEVMEIIREKDIAILRELLDRLENWCYIDYKIKERIK